MKWSPRRSAVASFAVLSLLLAGPTPLSRAEDKPEEKWLIDKSLTLSPAPAPVPVLKYRLFPSVAERKEGNAVPMYLRFAHERSDATKRSLIETPDRLNQLPLNALPLDEAKAFLKRWKYNLKQMELGARRKTADWNYALDAGNPIEILLPDVQEMRMQTPLLVLKARVEMAEGRYGDAVRTLETGLSFSQQISEAPFLISNLVGIAIASIHLYQVPELIQRPDAPNLYWALTTLPRPLIDLRKSMEFEQHMPQLMFPELTDLDRPRTAEQWDAALARFRKESQRILGIERQEAKPGTTASEPASKSPDLPAAKKYLTATLKTPAAAVEAMPPAQVLFLYIAHYNRELSDEQFKGAYLPYPEAQKVFDAVNKRLKALPDSEATRLVKALLPALTKVKMAESRLERLVALLRAVEALRLYAAAHGGQLPDKLEQVKEVPVPNDPGTGKPFEYRRDGPSATISSRLPGVGTASSGMRYRLTMRK